MSNVNEIVGSGVVFEDLPIVSNGDASTILKEAQQVHDYLVFSPTVKSHDNITQTRDPLLLAARTHHR